MTKKNPEYVRVMERAGFYFEGKPIPTVIEADSLQHPDQVDNNVKYKSLLDSEESHTVSVYELSGSPCIYFAQLSESHPPPNELSNLRRSAWNRGGAPLLWIITPAKVLIYNCYARPASDDQEDADINLLQLFEQTEAGLKQLNDVAGRLEIESGRFWQRPEAQKIDREERVDQSLLKDLNDAEQELTRKQLKPVFAHALLGRSIFVAYLQDRGILNSHFFRSNYGVENFAQLLNSKARTYHFFRWIRRTFNGDLFPLTRKRINRKTKTGRTVREEDRVKPAHLAIIQTLITSTEVATGQARLWPYDFSIIPVELISSIYENFAYSGDSKTARARSTHYTPFPLVDLVLGQVLDGMDGKAKALDMACGSGVFLVECFRRLVTKRVLAGEELNRKLIRQTLHEQIFGIDISREAIQIAAFSLYLTALELDPKPQPPSALKFKKLIGLNLFAANAFDRGAKFNSLEPFVSKSFDAIVGNPPWKSGRKTDHKLLLEYCNRRRYPLTRNTPDQAFLWRASDWARETAIIGMLLHGKPFFANTDAGRKARKAIFSRLRARVILNLADLRSEKLFPHSVAPTLIFIGDAKPPNQNDSFILVAPKRSSGIKRHGIIQIESEDIRTLRVADLVSDPDILKVASWATARDFALIKRLRNSYPTLEAFVKKNKCAVGQGFQRARGKKQASEMYDKPYLPPKHLKPYELSVENLEPLEKQGLHRTRNSKIYKGPLVITLRGLAGGKFAAAFCKDDVVYSESYFGISFSQAPHDLAHFLNGVANSDLINYFLFLTSSVWGVERDEVRPRDVLRIPLPLHDKPLVDRIVQLETALRSTSDSTVIKTLKQQLNSTVYDLYDLDDSERILVEDMIKVTLDLKINRTKSTVLKRPSATQLQRYANQVLGVLQPFLNSVNGRVLMGSVLNLPKGPLCIVQFASQPPQSNSTMEQENPALEAILAEIATHLPAKIASQIYAQRALRIYSEDLLYIVKPAEYRYWTRAAALSDADAILAEHQEGDNEDYIEPSLAGRSSSPSRALHAA